MSGPAEVVYSVAAQVAARLGIPSGVCFDLNNGCAGFCTALATADHALRAGAADHALVIGAEKMSDVTDWTDRGTCVLLGDGAGAAVISADKGQDTGSGPGTGAGIGPVVWGADPTRADAVRLAGAWQPRFAQEGQAVFRWATGETPRARRAPQRRPGASVRLRRRPVLGRPSRHLPLMAVGWEGPRRGREFTRMARLVRSLGG